jgi:peptidoglycan/LPS O-acetylase OafA/YrhL
MFLPERKLQWLKNIFLVFSYTDSPRLTPPAWALTVELFFYICIGLGLSKTRRITHYWFGLSVFYHIFIGVAGFDAAYRYFIIPAASLPFSTGALIFHYKEEIHRLTLRYYGVLYTYMPLILLVLVWLNWYAGFLICDLQRGFFSRSEFFYVNYLLNAFIVASLVNRKSLPYLSRKIDKAMGDLSYPIYLFHYQVGLLVIILAGLMGINLAWPGLTLLFISTPFIVFFSWLVARSVELPVEKIRSRVKIAGASATAVDQVTDAGVQEPQPAFSPRTDVRN